MSRKRLWAKFTLEFADHPKIAGLSDGAFRMLVEMILWSRQGLTDGFIPTAVAHRKWHTDSLTDSGYESLNELCTNDVRSPSLSEVEGGYQIHDFVEVQGSRDSVERRSEKNRANVKSRWERNEVRTVHAANTNRSAENREQRTDTPPTYVGGGVGEGKPSTSTGTRLPDDFTVTTPMRQWADTNTPGIDLQAATAEFVDYWRSVPGSRGRKVDWTATWRNSMRRYADQHRRATRPTTYRNGDQIMADVLADAQARDWPTQPPLTLIEGTAK